MSGATLQTALIETSQRIRLIANVSTDTHYVNIVNTSANLLLNSRRLQHFLPLEMCKRVSSFCRPPSLPILIKSQNAKARLLLHIIQS